MESHPHGSEASGISLPVSQMEGKLFHLVRVDLGMFSLALSGFWWPFLPLDVQLRDEFLSG